MGQGGIPFLKRRAGGDWNFVPSRERPVVPSRHARQYFRHSEDSLFRSYLSTELSNGVQNDNDDDHHHHHHHYRGRHVGVVFFTPTRLSPPPFLTEQTYETFVGTRFLIRWGRLCVHVFSSSRLDLVIFFTYVDIISWISTLLDMLPTADCYQRLISFFLFSSSFFFSCKPV